MLFVLFHYNHYSKTVTIMENFTSIEQSKRLLKLGVPIDSADCYIDEWRRVHFIPQEPQHTLYSELARRTIYTITPCWSAGQLIHIVLSYRKPNKLGHVWMDISEDEMTLIECLINQIRVDIEQGISDFSKWEK